MSRLRRYAQSISSGYLQVAANVVYTLLSVRLALHYLPTGEFGIWANVTQIVGYLALVDLGIAAALVRVLIDHKDRMGERTYGAVLKTGIVVSVLQGLALVLLAWPAGYVALHFMDVAPKYDEPFRWLVLGAAVIAGFTFTFRVFPAALQAHQRFDVVNYVTTAGFAINLVALWFSFRSGLGLASLLVAQALTILLGGAAQVWMAMRLGFVPRGESAGRMDRAVLKELFWFGNELLLLSVGTLLISASQVLIVTRVIGLEAAATWFVATKAFQLVQQVVWKVWDFSASAVAEMMVRDERERLVRRFRDLFIVTGSLSMLAAIGIACCNESLLAVWTRGRISWWWVNDVLLGLLFFVTSMTRLHVGLAATAKKIRTLRFIYLLEGVFFVVTALFFTRRWGMSAMLVCSVVMNVLWTGIYGTRRTSEDLVIPVRSILKWMLPAVRFGLLLGPLAFACFWNARGLPPVWRLSINAAFISIAGAALFWLAGITPELRAELRLLAGKVRNRF